MAVYYGGSGNDSDGGTSSADQMYGYGGNDSLFGQDGNDSLFGGDDADSINAGAGNDTVYGGTGDDTVSASTGYDLIYGDAGNDNLSGGSDMYDDMWGGAGDDSLYGGNYGRNRLWGGADNDLVYGGDGQYDSVYGGAGSDTLYAGAGNDIVDGGTGADSIQGGDGDDTLGGGAGQDILTGGAGADSFVLIGTDWGDVVTDFDLTLYGGRTLDQLDVSDLVDGNGNPIRAWQVQVADDGAGGSVLNFPSGETLTLHGVAPGSLQASGTLFSMGVPCFAQDMLIDCPDGPRRVQDLAVGDLVLAEGYGALPVAWVGKAELGRDDLESRPDLKPILIPAGSAGNHADVLLSPQHAVALPGQDVLVRARHLVGQVPGVRVARGKTSVIYHHILLDRHAMLSCHGLRSESLYPGPMTERMFPTAQRLSLALAITGLAGTAVVPTGGLAALYGPRCMPLVGRIKGDSLATATARAVGSQAQCI